MKHVKKVALMLATILLIISLTSCEFLKSLFASPQTQDDWIPESREQTDMIFANYMDYAEKTIRKYFPDKNVRPKCEMDEEGVLSYVFDLEFDLDITVKLIYWCHYKRPCIGEMTALVYMQIDDTTTNKEIIEKLQPYTGMLNKIAKFSIYLFPENDPLNTHFQQIKDEYENGSNADDGKLNESKMSFNMDFPENNGGEPTSYIDLEFWGEELGVDGIILSLEIRGYLTNEHALEYQKSVS